MPFVSTLRIRLSPFSEMKRLPEPSNAMAVGATMLALVAAAVIARVAGGRGPREVGDGAAVRRDFPYHGVAGVGDIDVAGAIDRDVAGLVEFGIDGGAVLAYRNSRDSCRRRTD